MIDNIDIFIRYIIIGIISAYLLIYGLRPSVPYPEYVLEIAEHYWIVIILIIGTYYISLWDLKIALLLVLSIVALIFDLYTFAN
jgi:hypothetical protein|uniref:Uncharacterized protein n=1 Tax=viral metagenome TaxID=1070528 RepID=A0A6C0LJX8_9ZZZZ